MLRHADRHNDTVCYTCHTFCPDSGPWQSFLQIPKQSRPQACIANIVIAKSFVHAPECCPSSTMHTWPSPNAAALDFVDKIDNKT